MPDILIVDDQPENLELMQDILVDEGYRVRTAADADGTLSKLEAFEPDLILLDLWLRDSSLGGMEILEHVTAEHPLVPVIMISAHGNIERAVQAIERGAFTFIEKPLHTMQLLEIVKRSLEFARLRRENEGYRERDRTTDLMVGASPGITKLRRELDRAARTNSRILFRGPPGVGKQEAARYLHMRSPRAERPFVAISGVALETNDGGDNAYRLPERGLLRRISGGTLLIDEVGDLSPNLQSRLLRLVVDQTFGRGGEGTAADVRILATTSRDLRATPGEFRMDLYHRIAVYEFDVPALAERRGDVPMLASVLSRRIAENLGRKPREFSSKAEFVLQSYDWPGNVLELRNVVERILIVDGDGCDGPIEIGELPADIRGGDAAVPSLGLLNLVNYPIREARQMFERQYLLAHISREGGNVPRIAENIGMDRSALYRKLSSLGIDPETLATFRIDDPEGRGKAALREPEGSSAT